MNWIFLSLISALFSALSAVTQKQVLRTSDSLRFTTILSLSNLILILPLLLFYRVSWLETTTLLVVIFKTLLSGVAFLMVMRGIKRADIGQVLPLLVLTPGVVALIAFFFLGESLSSFDIWGIFLLIVGTFLVQYPVRSLASFQLVKNRRGALFIVVALALFSLTAVLDKFILKNYRVGPIDYWFYQHLILFLFFCTISLLFRRDQAMLVKTLTRFWKLILLISFFTLIYRYTFIVSVKMAPVALALSLKRISVLLVALFGGLYFREKSIARKVLATLIMLAGAALIIIW